MTDDFSFHLHQIGPSLHASRGFVSGSKSVDLSNSTGITSIKLENGTAAGTVNGVGSVASLSVSNQQQDVNFDSSTATTLALTLDTVANATGATQAKVDLGKATAAHKATTLNITANNANVELLDTKGTNVTTTLTVAATGTNTLKLTEAVKATAVTVTGTGSADLTGAAFTGALTKFDASANEGGVKADLQSTAIIAVTTGKGADTIKLNTAVVSGSSVDLGAGNDTLFAGAKLANLTKGANGGDGTDIISITDGSTLDATTAKYISNFETLDVSGGTGTYDVSLNSFATVQVDEAIAGALAGDIVFSNTANNFTLNLISKAKSGADFDVAKNTTINLKDSSGTTAKGTGETVTLTATFNDGNQNSSANGNINAQKVTVAGVENLVIQTSVGSTDGGTTAVKDSAYSLKANLVAAAAETITIKGAGSVDLSPANTIGVVTKIDASAATGNTTIDLSSHTKAVAFTGGDGVDTYKGSKAGDTIYTGKGADVVTFIADGTAAVRDTFVLKAKTDSQITDTSKDGKITLGSDTGFDSVTNFKTGAASTDDRLDLTNLGFSGAQRGVVDVNTKVVGTTDLTSIANLFNDPAGNRGVAISNLGGSDTYVFLDVNKDGNFTAADDIVIKLVAISTISETNINF